MIQTHLSPLSKKKKWHRSKHRPDIDRSSTDEERRGRNHGPMCGREARTLKEKKRKERGERVEQGRQVTKSGV